MSRRVARDSESFHPASLLHATSPSGLQKMTVSSAWKEETLAALASEDSLNSETCPTIDSTVIFHFSDKPAFFVAHVRGISCVPCGGAAIRFESGWS